jgi:hypothetical protein
MTVEIPIESRLLAMSMAVVDFPDPAAPRMQRCLVKAERGILTGPPGLIDSPFDILRMIESSTKSGKGRNQKSSCRRIGGIE